MTQLSITLFGVHGEALALRQQRLALIASNVANADTPGYRALDMDFSKALNAAIAEEPAALKPKVAGHIEISSDIATGQDRYFRSPIQSSRDRNTVDAEQEKAMFAKAALEYRASLTFFEGRIRSLMTAITGE